MATILEGVGLSFDDVLLVPRWTNIPSRFDESIDLSSRLLSNLTLKYPLISANMDTVTHSLMMDTMHKLGGLGIIHRFIPIEAHRVALLDAKSPNKIVCIGVGATELHRLKEMVDFASAVLIDIAHGHCQAVTDQIRTVKELYPRLPIIAGNIATAAAAEDLIEAGADCLKVGIGPGCLCSTRIQTGAGVPQLTAIMQVHNTIIQVNRPVTLIADGGIKHSGDIVKALAAGADAVMIGGLFAGTEEAPGEVFGDYSGQRYKIYRGMASREAQLSWKGSATSIEGEVKRIPYRGPVAEIFKSLVNGILSGMSYQNARNLSQLREEAVFQKQTQAGYLEGTPHALFPIGKER